MGVEEKLNAIGKYVRGLWRSTNAESYEHYRRGRERTRKEEEQTAKDAQRHRERQREGAERGREYVERYRAERAAAEPRTNTAPDADDGPPSSG